MKQVKCVITDDEPTACEGLQRYVEKVDFLSLMGVCEDTMQLNTLLQTEQPDLLFLDIEMPYLSGLELLASQYSDDLHAVDGLGGDDVLVGAERLPV